MYPFQKAYTHAQLEISIIHNPTKARSVSVTPLTTDDWEILVRFTGEVGPKCSCAHLPGTKCQLSRE